MSKPQQFQRFNMVHSQVSDVSAVWRQYKEYKSGQWCKFLVLSRVATAVVEQEHGCAPNLHLDSNVLEWKLPDVNCQSLSQTSSLGVARACRTFPQILPAEAAASFRRQQSLVAWDCELNILEPSWTIIQQAMFSTIDISWYFKAWDGLRGSRWLHKFPHSTGKQSFRKDAHISKPWKPLKAIESHWKPMMLWCYDAMLWCYCAHGQIHSFAKPAVPKLNPASRQASRSAWSSSWRWQSKQSHIYIYIYIIYILYYSIYI